jgi:hypothetical protein
MNRKCNGCWRVNYFKTGEIACALLSISKKKKQKLLCICHTCVLKIKCSHECEARAILVNFRIEDNDKMAELFFKGYEHG